MPKTSHRGFNTVIVGQSLGHLFNMNISFFFISVYIQMVKFEFTVSN